MQRASSESRRRFLWVLLTLAVVAALCLRSAAPPRIHLVFLHTNDIHGQVLPLKGTWISKTAPPDVGGLPVLAAKLAELRAELPDAIVVDAGDWYQGTPEGTEDGGLPFLSVLARLPYDALCLGNHDFDRGVGNLEALVRKTRLPAIAANVRAQAERLSWAAPWIIVERNGVRIALVGLLTPKTPRVTSPEARSLEFASPAEELARVRAEIGSRADLVVPVGHLDVDEARELARSDPSLPLVVSGHSHVALPHGVREGETTIVQTGSKACAIGRVDLWLDARTFETLECTAQLIELRCDAVASRASEASVDAIRAACDELVQRTSGSLDLVVGELTDPLTRGGDATGSTAGAWLADALRERMSADIGMHNRGGMRCDLPAGEVTRRGLFEFLPFDRHVVTLELKGAQLLELVRRTIEGTKPLGLDTSGMTVYVKSDRNGVGRVVGIDIDGKPLELERKYSIATSSFLADGGAGCIEFLAAENRQDDPALLRDVLEEVLTREKRIAPPANAHRRRIEKDK
ncbi:MAG TPA: bifunctional UDP-sugar hydrolase/5'-nucleotidase [Planctomycetota bacterium]|nr:bifunctional UDP-sugar hydrolase/5'-nucleotidase [Planctomycetota bacterium]